MFRRRPRTTPRQLLEKTLTVVGCSPHLSLCIKTAPDGTHISTFCRQGAPSPLGIYFRIAGGSSAPVPKGKRGGVSSRKGPPTRHVERHWNNDQGSLRPPSAPLSRALEANDFQGFRILVSRLIRPMGTRICCPRFQESANVPVEVSHLEFLHLV